MKKSESGLCHGMRRQERLGQLGNEVTEWAREREEKRELTIQLPKTSVFCESGASCV